MARRTQRPDDSDSPTPGHPARDHSKEPARQGKRGAGAQPLRADWGGHRPHVLVVSGDRTRREFIAGELGRLEIICTAAASLTEARSALRKDQRPGRPIAAKGAAAGAGGCDAYEAAVVDVALPDGSGLDLLDDLRDSDVSAILACASATLDDAINAIKLGAADLLSGPIDATTLRERVTCAVRARRSELAHAEECAALDRDESDVPARNPADTPAPSTTPSAHANALTLPASLRPAANSFASLIASELDIETLLRRVLEFVLEKSGPTNAAVFLPGTTGDYSLGAYVNYDCPRDTVEVLLDQLANSVAPRFAGHTNTLHLKTQRGLEAFLADDPGWIGSSQVLGVSCDHDGETLGVILLFKDRRTVFSPGLADTLRSVAPVFAAQLARLIHIHHRHLPKDKWGALLDPHDDDDEGGLAA